MIISAELVRALEALNKVSMRCGSGYMSDSAVLVCDYLGSANAGTMRCWGRQRYLYWLRRLEEELRS